MAGQYSVSATTFRAFVTRKDTYTKTLKYQKKVDGVTSDLDITGATVYVFLFDKKSNSAIDGNALVTKTITVHTSPTEGETQFSFDSTDTDLARGEYYLKARLETATGGKYTAHKADFTICL